MSYESSQKRSRNPGKNICKANIIYIIKNVVRFSTGDKQKTQAIKDFIAKLV